VLRYGDSGRGGTRADRARQGGHGGRLEWDAGSAHNARYDAQRSADIFCLVCNRLRDSHQAAEERGARTRVVERGGRAGREEPPLEAEVPPL